MWTRALLAAAFAWVVYAAATRPVTVAEAALWDHLVRPPLRESFFAPDAWSGLLYGVLAKRSAGLFRLSEFSLRLPAALACAVCFWILLGSLRDRKAQIPALLLAVAGVAAGWFWTAGGPGLALAFCALALRFPRFAGPLYGLAIAASPFFAIPLALLAFWCAVRIGISTVERVALPALTTAFLLLILPLSHAAVPDPRTAIGGREEAAVRETARSLRGRGPLRIAAALEIRPLLEFYRARYRERAWELTDRDPQIRIAPGGVIVP